MTVASDLAAQLLAQLGQDFSVPAVNLNDARYALPVQAGNPLYDAVPEQDIEALTTGVVDGEGAFDKVMASTKAHLQEQYDRGVITGDQYAKAYIELTTAALGTALQFVLQNDQAYWQAIIAQGQARKAEIDAVRAGVELETSKHQLAAAVQQTKTLKAQHALIQMQTANEDAKYGLAQKQSELLDRQVAMVREQTEAQRAQTVDVRTDGIPVSGMIGKQKSLYEQQVISYKRDAEVKVGKILSDAWITQKSIDEGIIPPNQFTNLAIDAVFEKLRANNLL